MPLPSRYTRPLQPRLIAFGVAVCRLVTRLPKNTATANIAKQLVRSSMSPAANYAEARGAESRRDFRHKLQIGLKELRETAIWLEALRRLLGRSSELTALQRECKELIAMFVASVNKLTPG